MTLGKLFIAKRTFIIYKKTTKIYSLGNECPLARVHCLACDTISSKESWIVRCSRLRHAVIIELQGSSKLCGCCWCGTFQICCLRYPHRKTSHIARSWPISTVTHQSRRKLSAEVLHCCMTGMRRSSILLPPHDILIDIMSVKIPLYNMVTYNT